MQDDLKIPDDLNDLEIPTCETLQGQLAELKARVTMLENKQEPEA